MLTDVSDKALCCRVLSEVQDFHCVGTLPGVLQGDKVAYKSDLLTLMGIQLPSKYRLMTLPTFSMDPPLEKVLTLSTLRVGATFSVSLAPLSRLNVLCAAPSAYTKPQ